MSSRFSFANVPSRFWIRFFFIREAVQNLVVTSPVVFLRQEDAEAQSE
jgi:hypothetical protein